MRLKFFFFSVIFINPSSRLNNIFRNIYIYVYIIYILYIIYRQYEELVQETNQQIAWKTWLEDKVLSKKEFNILKPRLIWFNSLEFRVGLLFLWINLAKFGLGFFVLVSHVFSRCRTCPGVLELRSWRDFGPWEKRR